MLRITLLLFIVGNSVSAAAPTKRLTLRRKLVAARVTVKNKKRGSRNFIVGMIMMRSRWLKAGGEVIYMICFCRRRIGPKLE